jgi:type I restriction enzyme, S subunit
VSYSTYPEYRDSGFKWIGNIPESWEVRRLKNVLDSPVTDGPHSTPNFLHEGIPFLSVDGIQDGELQFESCRFVSVEDHQQFAKKAAPRKGDVLLGKAASTGKIAQVKVDFEFNIWSPLALLRPNQAEIIPTYLEYALKSPAVQAQIDVLCTHNTQSNISMDDIPKLVLPLPSNVEQQQIAEFLDWKTGQIDALIVKKKELMEKLKEKRLAVITQAVTKGLESDAQMRDSAIPCLGSVPSHWVVTRLRYNAGLVTSGSRGWAQHFADSGALFLRITNLNRESIELLMDDIQRVEPPEGAEGARTFTKAGDLLISITADLGSVAVIPSDMESAYVSQHLSLVRLDTMNIDPHWIAYSVFSHAGKFQLQTAGYGGTKVQLSLSDIKEIVFCHPPALKEQQRILEFIRLETARSEELISLTSQAIARLTEYRTALITAATTGKIDVRHVAIPAPT